MKNAQMTPSRIKKILERKKKILQWPIKMMMTL